MDLKFKKRSYFYQFAPSSNGANIVVYTELSIGRRTVICKDIKYFNNSDVRVNNRVSQWIFRLIAIFAILFNGLCVRGETSPLGWSILGHNVMFDDALEYMANDTHFTITEIDTDTRGINGSFVGKITFEYDCGKDWLTGYSGNFFITTAYFNDTFPPDLEIKPIKDRISSNDEMENYVWYVKKYFTSYYGVEPLLRRFIGSYSYVWEQHPISLYIGVDTYISILNRLEISSFRVSYGRCR